MSALPLVSINIERSKHLDLVLPFLERARPDVFCLQELVDTDVPVFEKLGYHSSFAPMNLHPSDVGASEPLLIGVGIFSRSPIRNSATHYYAGGPERIREEPVRALPRNRLLLSCEVEKDGQPFRFATTHFTWTHDAGPSDEQRRDMRALLRILESFPDIVLCGDFNAPRIWRGSRGEIFGELASRYTDHIPPRYTTSIDASLHKAGDLSLMVDGLFSTPEYAVSNVQVHFGVSDHAAISGDVVRA